jgi:sucrose-6F-phosphate phosphohydrolase
VKYDLILISDLDDTLLGDDDALARFAEFVHDCPKTIGFVYASGRFCKSFEQDIANTPLPEPIAMIGGVGSEIRSYPGNLVNQHWIERISKNWSAQQVRAILKNEPGLELQPEENQSDFKVSYYFRDASGRQIDELKSRLNLAGIETSVIYSSNRDLDFLPGDVNKGTAASFLVEDLGLDRQRIVVAGNSGNDARMFEHGFYGIVVDNARDDLKQFASDNRVHLSRFAYADGVRDGLQHWLRQLKVLP